MALEDYTAADLLGVEDDLQEILGNIREIRKGMWKDGPEAIRLNFGTFLLYVRELKRMAEEHKGKYYSQKAVAHAKTARGRRKKSP